MNHEMDPSLRVRAESFLKLKPESNFYGIKYLKSGVKRALDLGLSVPSSPFWAVASGIGASVVFADDGNWPTFVNLGIKGDGVLNNDVNWYKIRTMIPNAREREGEYVGGKMLLDQVKGIKNDPRVTTAGRLIRSWHGDDIPLLSNVAIGDISIVGPRIYAKTDWERVVDSKKENPYSGFISLINNGMKFGITGMFIMFRSESSASLADRTALEVMYGQRATLSTDLKIIAKTIPLVKKPTG